MREDTYRARKAVNKSTLWAMTKSPAHYKYGLEHPAEDTAAMRIGRAAHCLILRPRAFKKEFDVLPEGLDRRTKEGKKKIEEITAEAVKAGKELITPAEYEQIQGMAKAVQRSGASAILKGTKKELPIFWTDEDTGLKCKAKLDAMGDGIIIDLKTAADAGTDAFIRDAIKRGYDVQAAHYIRGCKALYGWKKAEWYFIVVEKEPPYAVNILHASEGFIDRGTWQLIDLLGKLKECNDTHSFPDYGENELVLPSWAELY